MAQTLQSYGATDIIEGNAITFRIKWEGFDYFGKVEPETPHNIISDRINAVASMIKQGAPLIRPVTIIPIEGFAASLWKPVTVIEAEPTFFEVSTALAAVHATTVPLKPAAPDAALDLYQSMWGSDLIFETVESERSFQFGKDPSVPCVGDLDETHILNTDKGVMFCGLSSMRLAPAPYDQVQIGSRHRFAASYQLIRMFDELMVLTRNGTRSEIEAKHAEVTEQTVFVRQCFYGD